ncbi:hypothetical protein BCR34DRAFT_224280 [Clohesyomyces aquaticus]|uniref:Uncharacterized protein n=1 Tax=Clohesyomyces aquaticus TaxID=1231657 RepID=A0A1Y1ZXZ8_9PLEO|nr:hypothetical protein BCR34DRAFT_224280 [Clohesyomyces aquaticus]
MTVWVDESTGTLKPEENSRNGTFRFSFRKNGVTGAWDPNAQTKILSGDSVSLWCHSLNYGWWKNITSPPTDAYRAWWNATQKILVFQTGKVSWDPAWGMSRRFSTLSLCR